MKVWVSWFIGVILFWTLDHQKIVRKNRTDTFLQERKESINIYHYVFLSIRINFYLYESMSTYMNLFLSIWIKFLFIWIYFYLALSLVLPCSILFYIIRNIILYWTILDYTGLYRTSDYIDYMYDYAWLYLTISNWI